ncbi:hypothetical protein PsYK624_072470 [Phanerochaete sordida]|uniref:AB hydrolase-1 domain-containing protein n=1 Tax=Phanerochaete sordida TaxID=48140 RepID=A0A9P3G844_9APHY|nr:hypothetical protein PsYK624_072470 [Phanerochaete sordida]
MPLAQLDSKGTSIYYEDSGPPVGIPIYTTLVIVHGALINSATFDRMLPLAPKHGLRLITMNSRDYRGSTPYTTEELADMTSPDIEVQASAVRRWGREVAQFLAYVCQTLRIPATVGAENKQAGGLVLAVWSLSGAAALALLGDPRTMGTELTSTLAPYLRKIILYDPPCIVYGVSPAIGLKWPYADPSIPPAQKPDAFVDWVSAYHPAFPTAPITAPAVRAHAVSLPLTPTLRTLEKHDFARTVDAGTSARSLNIMATDARIHVAHARRACFDADAVLPRVDVLALWCDQTVWLCTWGAKVFQDFMREPAEAGKRKRRMASLRVRNVNHFAHWDEPERMVRLFAEQIGAERGSLSSRL